MNRGEFHVQVQASRSAVRVVPRGELDIATAARLRDVLRDQEERASVILLDLSELTFVDISGLRVVGEEHNRALRGAFVLQVVVGRGAARRLLELVGAPELFPWVAG